MLFRPVLHVNTRAAVLRCWRRARPRAAKLLGAWSEDSYELGVLAAATAGTAAAYNGLGASVDLSVGLLFVVACEIDGGAV